MSAIAILLMACTSTKYKFTLRTNKNNYIQVVATKKKKMRIKNNNKVAF